MNKKLIDLKIEQIHRALDLLLRQTDYVLKMTEQLFDDLEEIEYAMTNKKSLLRFIHHMDRLGINMEKLVVFERLKYINNLEEVYVGLLKDGDIMEIQGKVYPFNSKNEQDFE